MPQPPGDSLLAVDRSLRAMRRMVEPPADVGDATRIEGSTVLVLEAVLDGGASTVRDVAHQLAVAHSTASRLVTRAEQAGVVRRRPSPANGRETLVEATDRGLVVRERGVRFRLERLAALTEGWTPEEVETFAHLLERFAGGTGSERTTVEAARHQDRG